MFFIWFYGIFAFTFCFLVRLKYRSAIRMFEINSFVKHFIWFRSHKEKTCVFMQHTCTAYSHSQTVYPHSLVGIIIAILWWVPGGVLWYFRTYVGSVCFFWFKILNFNIFWGFQKNEYILGVWSFCGYFLGSSQNKASLRVISMQFRVFF